MLRFHYESGSILSVQYRVPRHCAPGGSRSPEVPSKPLRLAPTASVAPLGELKGASFEVPVAGPAGQETQQAQPPQSFLRKYWMYILPAALLVSNLLGSAVPEEESAGKGAGGRPRSN